MKILDEKRKRIALIKGKNFSAASEYHQLHINKIRNQEIEKKDGFNLQKHLTAQTDYYGEDMSEEQKKEINSRISLGNNIQHLPDLDYFPADHPEDLTDVYSKNSFMHEKGNAIAKELLKEFCDAGSRAGNDLKEILENSDVEILIRSKWDRPNGTAAFKRKNNNQKKDKIVICLSDLMFTDEHIDKLPGLLAHEASHILDFKKRSGGGLQYMDGAETFADNTGQIMAAKAGYSSLYWGEFMNEEFNANGRKKMNMSPDGDFRLRTIKMSARYTPPSPEKNVRDLSSYKKYAALEKTGQNIAALRGTQSSRQQEQKKEIHKHAQHNPATYIAPARDR